MTFLIQVFLDCSKQDEPPHLDYSRLCYRKSDTILCLELCYVLSNNRTLRRLIVSERPSRQQSSIFLVSPPSCSLQGTSICLLDPLWISPISLSLADNHQLVTSVELGGTLTDSGAAMTVHGNHHHDVDNQQDANDAIATSPWPPPCTI